MIKGIDYVPEKKELNRPELFSLEQTYFDDHIIKVYKIISNVEKVNRNQLLLFLLVQGVEVMTRSY